MLRTEHVDISFNLKLQKDLQEHEVICSHCGGSGLQIDDAPFGLRKEGIQPANTTRFPYKKQTIVGCRHCYNGIQKKCIHCGEILDRQKYQCDCIQAKYERNTKQFEKDLETWNKAKKISFNEALEKYAMVYIENYDKYCSTEDLLDYITDIEYDYEKPIDKKSLWIYGTYTMELSLDADCILENACDNLHENAMNNISSNEIRELQDLLDQWAEKIKEETTTYYADYKIGILLP
jgi:hypothetical protein